VARGVEGMIVGSRGGRGGRVGEREGEKRGVKIGGWYKDVEQGEEEERTGIERRRK